MIIYSRTVIIFVLVLVTCFCCCRKKIQVAKQEAEELARARETARLISTAKEKDAPIPQLDQRRRSTLKDILACLLSPQKSAAKAKTFKNIVDKRKREKQILTNELQPSTEPKTLPASENKSSIVPFQSSQAPNSKNDQLQQPSNEVIQIGQPSSDRSNEKHNPPLLRKTLRAGPPSVNKETNKGTVANTAKMETNVRLSKETTTTTKTKTTKKSAEKILPVDKTQESTSVKTVKK